ncbi:MAG TPA: tyrosine-type recombinase/integrase [Fimbriiglobus sp.]|jgi:integrase|nr:tyrosine-type recombinase/integrase [Fimbriiglobus sp.]
MSADHPTAAAKPSKPYPDFPLFPHATGRWAKKIRGKMHYFGPWDDSDAALKKYLEQRGDLHAGRKPRPDAETMTIKALANAYLNHKKAMLDAGELSPHTWTNYREVADLLVTHFGKQRAVDDLGPDDFADLRNIMAKRWGPVRVRDFVQRIRSVFKFGYDVGVMVSPMRFGPGFARPSKKTIRLERARKGPRMFEAVELRRILDAAGTPMKAMIMLGVNCGFGNADCGTLPLAALDLAGGWVNYHRPKTGITRRCPLWPETVEAVREAMDRRREPKDLADSGLVFLTSRGSSWHKKIADNPVSKEMRKLLDALGINGHRNFYALRHTFETVGGEAKDQVAVDHIMGHARDDMASVYRERISDERLRAVADHVRDWLFGDASSISSPSDRGNPVTAPAG